MAMAHRNRADFPKRTKVALALRANYRCSFPGCGLPTSGPSEEGPDKTLSLGDASHIHAASEGGPRYLSTMTPEQRSDIQNGIWLCALHNRLVDDDTIKYTADALKQMKRDHEENVINEIERHRKTGNAPDLVAVGQGIVCVGELLGTTNVSWRVRIDHFIAGDISRLIDHIERFESIDKYDRYVLVDAIGEGRQLAGPPSWEKVESGYVIDLPIKPSAARTNAHNLPTDLALNETHDIFVANGDIATVSGLDALPQKIASCLSTQRGEMWFHPKFGVHLQEYVRLYGDSIWLPHFIKLEVIRMACIPYDDSGITPEQTPLQCVRRVLNVEVIKFPKTENWIPFHFELDLEGLGIWRRDIPIFLPSTSTATPTETYTTTY